MTRFPDSRRALLRFGLGALIMVGSLVGPATTRAEEFPFESAGPVVYEANCCNAWVEGRIRDTTGRPLNGALVKVRGRDGWETVSRPSGGEARPAPEGVYFITLRAGPEQLMDYSWTVWMVDSAGRALSAPVEVFTDGATTLPESRQVIRLDFQQR